ncbi:MAG: glycoside hydrolase family 97 N-terminal domain-containing protein [Bacteroidales bacterium]
MKFKIAILAVLLVLNPGCKSGKKITVLSPDGSNKLTFTAGYEQDGIRYPAFALENGNRQVIVPSPVRLDAEGIFWGNFTIGEVKKESVRDQWINNFGERKEIPDNYNQASIRLENDDLEITLICRAYDEGVAFSLEFPRQDGIDSILINEERISFGFTADHPAWSANRAQAAYSKVPLSKIRNGCERPLVIEIDTGLTIALAEAKLVDYARMKFEHDTTRYNNVITQLEGTVNKALPFQTPWRVVMTGKDPGDLLEKNYLILNLNDPCALSDVSWIKPGKALREVTLTTAGAIAAIDFTSSHNMQYVEFDAGWYGPENNDSSDARAVNLDPARSKGPLNMKEVLDYARSKDIGILLYVNRGALERQIDELLPLYRDWGIAGIKFGFVRVGTQDATAWLHESIMKAAEYKLVADVHDEYRPTGFSRTYPNFLTMEGIRGDEESPSNSHTLITMFTRMLAGQGDNTICYYNERVENKMGSHASQLAKSVCIFSPLQFLYWYDKAAPALKKDDGLWGATNYIGNEPELEFFDNVLTVWDETRVLHAKIGEYGVIARKRGDEWFIGGINGANATKLDINFSFLDPEKKYSAKIYSDDRSVNTRTHVRIDSMMVDRRTIYTANLNPNNGIAMHLMTE